MKKNQTKKLDYKKSHDLLLMLLTGGTIVAFLGLGVIRLAGSSAVEVAGAVIALIGAAAMGIGFIQALIFYRCPRCNRRLTLRGGTPEHCRGCGQKLDL